jgi:hypothetical protein
LTTAAQRFPLRPSSSPIFRSEVPPAPAPLSLSPFPVLKDEFSLRTANFTTIMHTFYKLPAPSPPLEGEYLAELLDAGTG